jgi:hypothetical protein
MRAFRGRCTRCQEIIEGDTVSEFHLLTTYHMNGHQIKDGLPLFTEIEES